MAYSKELVEGVTYLSHTAGGARVITVVNEINGTKHYLYLADDHTKAYSAAEVEQMKSLGFEHFPAKDSEFGAEDAQRTICFEPGDVGQRDYYSYFFINI